MSALDNTPALDRRRLLIGGLAGLTAFAATGSASVFTAPKARAAGDGSRLHAGQQLNPGERITSPNGGYFFIQQQDGNAVLYTNAGTPLWTTRSNGSSGAFFANQTDGNLVLYTPGGPTWASGTNGRGAGDLVVQDDGNLVLYTAGGPTWASGTAGGRANLGQPVNAKTEAAISWFVQRTGSSEKNGYCESAVEFAYGIYRGTAGGGYTSAIANWNERKARGQARYPYSAAPRGALVFYNTSANGHVAISTGDGRVVSTSVGSRIGTVAIGYFQRPLGWAPAPW